MQSFTQSVSRGKRGKERWPEKRITQESNALKAEVKQILAEDQDLLKALVTATLQQALEVEMYEALGAEKGGVRRTGWGTARLLRPDAGDADREDRTAGAAGPAGPVPDGSIRSLSAQREGAGDGDDGSVFTKGFDGKGEGSDRRAVRARLQFGQYQPNWGSAGRLEKFARRGLEDEYPYLVLDARYQKVREDGAVRSQAVLIAIGIDWEGRRNVLAVEMANRESASIRKEFLSGMRERGAPILCIKRSSGSFATTTSSSGDFMITCTRGSRT
jgi:putative transposase